MLGGTRLTDGRVVSGGDGISRQLDDLGALRVTDHEDLSVEHWVPALETNLAMLWTIRWRGYLARQLWVPYVESRSQEQLLAGHIGGTVAGKLEDCTVVLSLSQPCGSIYMARNKAGRFG